jgi:hypothetical protein
MRTRPGLGPAARSAFAGFGFPPDIIVLAVRWYCASGCRIATSRNSWLSAASRSTMSLSTAGCSGSRHCWPTPPVPAGAPWETAGGSTRPMSWVAARRLRQAPALPCRLRIHREQRAVRFLRLGCTLMCLGSLYRYRTATSHAGQRPRTIRGLTTTPVSTARVSWWFARDQLPAVVALPGTAKVMRSSTAVRSSVPLW